MIRVLKKFTLRLIAGANIATIVVMLLVGFSGYLNPIHHPFLANAGLLFPVFLLLNFGFLFFWLLFKPKWALIPLLGYVVGYSPVHTYLPLNVPQEVPDSALKVVSFNVENFGDDPEEASEDGHNKIVRYLTESHADVICLQEAGSWRVQGELDSAMNADYPYRHVLTKENGSNTQRLYSKFPIASTERISYPSVGNMSIAYKLNVNGRLILVINNHLESNLLNGEDKKGFTDLVKGKLDQNVAREKSTRLIDKLTTAVQKRAPQADAVADYIHRHRQMAMIVCGDFNDTPLSYAHRTVGKGLVDCFVTTGNGLGYSYHRSRMYVRIDHIFCSHDWKPYKCFVDSKIKSSDHYPIVCWLKMR